MIMAGGESPNLSVLTETRSEPAVPFGGKFRLVDFSLSNCVNSDIFNVAVLTQYRPRSLNDHIGIGKPWDLDRITGGVRLLQPYRGGPYGDWQKGSADAVRRNLDYVRHQDEPYVLILSGKHVYVMDYRPFIQHHVESGAEVTVAVRRVSLYETYRFGIVSTRPDGRIVEFQEKPQRSPRNLASMGIYIFNKDFLIDVLESDTTAVDFGRDVLPSLVAQERNIQAYTYPGYWADVSTVQTYWEANMGLLAEEPALDLYDPQWRIHTRSEERAPVKLGPHADVDGTLLSNGCIIEGTVERSVLSPGVQVAEGAVVRDSIILNDTVIEAGAVVDRCIVDKQVHVGAEARVGHGDNNKPNVVMPERLNTGLTLIGKGSVIPPEITIGRNVVVHPFSGEEAFGGRKRIRSGGDVGKDLR
ncbi:MAG: glucose-1-phosphate adenylyltransferase subunit GlgD [Caldilineae bacterium]|nr:MAG: glucose-1-phosphate adenylyltransferase subunit GlgD [Caldilineae bacterium]